MITSEVKSKDTTWQFVIGDVPFSLDKLIEEVSNFDEEWKLDTSRQDKLATHKDTEMFQLRFMDYWWEVGQGNLSKNINNLKNDKSQNTINSLYKYLEDLYDAKVVRCEIVKMHKHSSIPTHIDSGEFLYLGRRIHVPLVTNKDITFTVLNHSLNMQVGKWYDINNSLPHSVDNPTDTERIHIIIDLIFNNLLDK